MCTVKLFSAELEKQDNLRKCSGLADVSFHLNEGDKAVAAAHVQLWCPCM